MMVQVLMSDDGEFFMIRENQPIPSINELLEFGEATYKVVDIVYSISSFASVVKIFLKYV
jgi:hypothetical protein